MIPYLPSLQTLSELCGFSQPTQRTNLHPNRALISANNGSQWLTIPILGGRHALNTHNQHSIQVSEHNNWRHKHLQAISSEYGRMPYFEHLFPLILHALHPQHTNLSQITTLTLHALTRIAFPNQIDNPKISPLLKSQTLQELNTTFPTLYSQPHASSLPAIMLLGPRTIFLL